MKVRCKRRLAAAATLGVALGGSGAMAADAGASFEGPMDDRIAIVREHEDEYGVYLFDPDEGHWTLLVQSAARKDGVALSPVGDKVAFAQDGDIFTVTTDGQRRLDQVTATPEREGQPAWSPDGSQLVFERTAPRMESDLVIRTLGTGDEEIIQLPGNDRDPDWSGAVGDKPLVFTSDATGTPQIWRANPSGGAPDAEQVTSSKHPSYQPVWSPDGTKVAFARWHPGKIGMALTVRDLDGGEERRLGNGNQDHGGDWSPDGAQIAYQHSAGNGTNVSHQLYRVNTTGTPTPQRIETGGNVGTPSWGLVPASDAATSRPWCDLLGDTLCR